MQFACEVRSDGRIAGAGIQHERKRPLAVNGQTEYDYAVCILERDEDYGMRGADWPWRDDRKNEKNCTEPREGASYGNDRLR
jgi:hypothetical protein